MKTETFIPALSYNFLTPFYDLVVRFTTREKIFKRALVEQAKVGVKHRVLDLGCGTATLTILLKQYQPLAEVIGIDGDDGILAIAKAKANTAGVEIHFDEGMSFDLPYSDESFDSVTSSLFFHHLSRENKVRTLREVIRVLKPDGEFHVADWGMPANTVMTAASRLIQLSDGFETTADNFNGLLPKMMADAGFEQIEEMKHYNTLFGTIRLHGSRRA